MVWFVLTYQYMGCWNIPLHPYVGGEGGGGEEEEGGSEGTHHR